MTTTKKNITNDKAIRNAVKAVEELGVLAPGILRERMLTLFLYNLDEIERDPEQFKNPIISVGQIKGVLQTAVEELEF